MHPMIAVAMERLVVWAARGLARMGFARCARRARWVRGAMAPALLVTALAAAAAGGTCKDFLKALGQRESGMNASAHNPFGYVGLFQMGEAALIDAGYYRRDGTGRNDWTGSWTGKDGVTNLAQFKADPAAQVKAIEAYHQRLWGYISARGLDKFIGQTIGGVEVTRSGLIGGAHLVGTGGLARFLNSNGSDLVKDGFGTTVASYVAQFGGYELTGAGADCAGVMGGTPTGGVGYDEPPPAPPPTAPFYAQGLATDRIGMEAAFYSMAGMDVSSSMFLIKMATCAVLFGIAAWTVFGNWALYARGWTTWHHFLQDNQRVLIVTTLMLVVLML